MTPEEIRQIQDNLTTPAKVNQLVEVLDLLMPPNKDIFIYKNNMVNGGIPPREQVIGLLSYVLDWYMYGN